MWRWPGSGMLLTTVLLGALAAAPSILEGPQQTQQTQPAVSAQKPPVFRAGAHYVRVDAYPTTKDGKIVEGLTKGDFEIYEDGKPQAIESAEYITFDTWTPDAERKDPRTQQDAYDLAADPSTLVGDPQAFRSGPRGLAIPVALFEFTREERLKLDWPVLATLDHSEVHLLDRYGQPLRHRVSVKEQDGGPGPHLVSELSFTALGRGDYVVELAATAAGVTERKLLAFRIR